MIDETFLDETFLKEIESLAKALNEQSTQMVKY
jgi:hypothetical protein